MGLNMVSRLLDKDNEVVVHNRSPQPIEQAVALGASGAMTMEELSNELGKPAVLWLMVSHEAVDIILDKMRPFLEGGDVVIDGGNSYYKDSQDRYQRLSEKGVDLLDVGVSGGPKGAKHGAAVMVGGKHEVFSKLEKLFEDLSVENGYAYLGPSGAGHFAKMVHNGIEYGMMQSMAEGFDLLRSSEFDYDIKEVLKPYRHGSVISSRLMDWLSDAFERYGQDLAEVSGTAEHSGEGKWTVEEAAKRKVEVKVIEQALQARIKSEKEPNYQAKIISALRGEFGGHEVTSK